MKTRYDWSTTPDEVVCKTTDKDGWIKEHYIENPKIIYEFWSKTHGDLEMDTGKECEDWRESLEYNPNRFKTKKKADTKTVKDVEFDFYVMLSGEMVGTAKIIQDLGELDAAVIVTLYDLSVHVGHLHKKESVIYTHKDEFITKKKGKFEHLRNLPVDTKVIVWENGSSHREKAHFSHVNGDGNTLFCFDKGLTSWTIRDGVRVSSWDNCEIAE